MSQTRRLFNLLGAKEVAQTRCLSMRLLDQLMGVSASPYYLTSLVATVAQGVQVADQGSWVGRYLISSSLYGFYSSRHGQTVRGRYPQAGICVCNRLYIIMHTRIGPGKVLKLTTSICSFVMVFRRQVSYDT